MPANHRKRGVGGYLGQTLPRGLRGNQLAGTLMSDFRPPDHEAIHFCCLKPRGLRHFVRQSREKMYYNRDYVVHRKVKKDSLLKRI